MGLMIGLVGWYHFIHRASGNEQWGDAVVLFNVGIVAYPVSLLLLGAGVIVRARGRGSQSGSVRFGANLIVASLIALAIPGIFMALISG